jgi:thiamine biosynthesis lipoprotein
MERITLARNAMATRFEMVLLGDDPVRLRAAGEEALDEIDRLEGQLSLYQSGSEIAQVNRRAASEPVRVSPAVFQLLQACRALSEITGGSFDISVAPLARCWGFLKGRGTRPTDAEIATALGNVGIRGMELDETRSTVRFTRPGMMIDLGSVGKGYALDAAVDILRENGISNALLHGGTSTVYGIGADPEGGAWKVAIEFPSPDSGQPASVPCVVELRDQALSVSAVWGKHFVAEGVTYGHVIDPRTGWPARDALLGAVVVDSAAVSDALSTGVLLGSEEELNGLVNRVPGLKYLQISNDREEPGKIKKRALGLEIA